MTSIVDSDAASSVIRSDSRGRMLVAADQREALLDEFERSGLSGMAYCRLHRLTSPTFATWVQKRRRRPTAQSAAFAEVVIESRTEAAVASDGQGLRLTLASGTTLEVTRRSQLPLLVELLRSLDSQPSC